ncbi:MAG: hypothetical protein OXC03_04525 [Flavobacteriaceae bacterium]|nr:hypothetical protein [Flavobacteriaceae bacterium]
MDHKNLEVLDIVIPVLNSKFGMIYRDLNEIDLLRIEFSAQTLKEYNEKAKRDLFFEKVIDGNISHKIELEENTHEVNLRKYIREMTISIFKNRRLISGKEILYEKIKRFVEIKLFGQKVNLGSDSLLRNLSYQHILNEIENTFMNAINKLNFIEYPNTYQLETLKSSLMKPCLSEKESYVRPKKSIFNKIIGDSDFELKFASFLEMAKDVKAYIKCYKKIGFKIDYINSEKKISNYYPDFIVKLKNNEMYVIETKGDLFVDKDTELKRNRLGQWCKDVTEQLDQKYSSFSSLIRWLNQKK